MKKKVVLSIGGSDPSCGAGVQADIRTIDRFGCYPCSVVTLITAQNSFGFRNWWHLDDKQIESQLKCVLDDIRPDAVKIGWIRTESAITIISRLLKEYRIENIVVDPVMGPTLNYFSPSRMAVDALVDELFPLAALVTPNKPEFEVIEKISGNSLDQLCNAYLLKGGHSSDEEIKDTLFFKDSGEWVQKEFRHRRIDTFNSHGSGCVLSSSIACGLAGGHSLEKSVDKAVNFLYSEMVNASKISIVSGKYGPVLV